MFKKTRQKNSFWAMIYIIWQLYDVYVLLVSVPVVSVVVVSVAIEYAVAVHILGWSVEDCY